MKSYTFFSLYYILETDRKRYWEYVEIDSDKAPAKAFHAVDGPRIKKNKFNFSP